MLDAPPSKKRPVWNAEITVEPNAKVSGSTWVACWLSGLVYGSVLIRLRPAADAGPAASNTRAQAQTTRRDDLCIDVSLQAHGEAHRMVAPERQGAEPSHALPPCEAPKPYGVAVGLNDSRVSPWESGKCGARLAKATRSGKPVWFRNRGDQGHFSGSLSEEAAETADTYTFFEMQLPR